MAPRSFFKEVRLDLRIDQAAMARRLRINRSYLSELENSHRAASPELIQRLRDLAQSLADRGGRRIVGGSSSAVPIVAWAKAGSAASYEEIARDWQNTLPSDCPDSRAFGLMLEGDSMEPKYSQGDVVVLMPQMRPRAHSLVVANIMDQGAVFKMYAPLSGHRIQLSSYNPAYPPLVVKEQDLAWIYPAYEVRCRIW